MSSLVFPDLPGLQMAVTRTAIHKTSIQEASSGKELRAARWSFPRYRYELNFEALRSTAALPELQTLFGFLARHLGSFDSFLFTDPEDNAVAAMPFGVGTGSILQFQLQRSMVPSGSLPAPALRAFWPASGDGYEPVFELNGAPQIWVDGVLKTAGTEYSISSTGLATFTAAPASGKVLTWTGSYYRRVRLASDEQEAERIVYQIWEAKGLELITVK